MQAISFRFFLTILVSLLLLPAFARAQYEINVTRGHADPLKLAIVPFEAAGERERALGQEIVSVIRSDLESTGLFRSIQPQAFIEKDVTVDVVPRYQDWRTIGAEVLVVGRVELIGDAKARVIVRGWSPVSGRPLFGTSYTTSSENGRRIGHRTADEIYAKLTGEDAYFDSRIVFIAESGPETDRKKRLAIMDQDGHNPIFLTNGNFTVITPRFSPTVQMITYMSYEERRPQVFLFDIERGRRERLGTFPGMTFSPRFTPNGRGVIMSQEQNGNSDIYHMDLRSRDVTRLTRSAAIDTSPSMSPDSRQVVFNSDRGGSPQLYVMDANGENVRRISFGSGYYSTPVWSPRGDLIAFTKQEKVSSPLVLSGPMAAMSEP